MPTPKEDQVLLGSQAQGAAGTKQDHGRGEEFKEEAGEKGLIASIAVAALFSTIEFFLHLH